MVIQYVNTKNKRRNYFMTTKEAMILYRESVKWGDSWNVLIGLCLFRGMRIGEAVAVNLSDFSNDEFDKLNIVLQKSHIVDEFPLIKSFALKVKEYIHNNIHLMKDGWLFPSVSSQCKSGHITKGTAISKLYKIRKKIGEKHPEFLEFNEFPGSVNKNAPTYKRYRISFHSCRRWFETQLWDKYKDKMLIRDIMRYSHSKTVDVYIDPYIIWKKERELLNSKFGSIFDNFIDFSKDQKKLTAFL